MFGGAAAIGTSVRKINEHCEVWTIDVGRLLYVEQQPAHPGSIREAGRRRLSAPIVGLDEWHRGDDGLPQLVADVHLNLSTLLVETILDIAHGDVFA